MKKLVFLVLATLFVAAPSFADVDVQDWRDRDGRGGWDRGGGRGDHGGRGGRDDRGGRGGRDDRGDWGRDDRGRGGYCTVAFKSCRIVIGGFCAKWKNATTTVRARDSRQACWQVERQYGNIKSCRASCGR